MQKKTLNGNEICTTLVFILFPIKVDKNQVNSIRCLKVAQLTMKGSPCCAGLMWSCLHTYRTKINLTKHIIQPWGGASAKYGGGASVKYGGGHQPSMGGGHQPSMEGVINQLWGGAISQVWGGHQPSMGGGVFSHQYVQEVKIHRITLATHTSCRL